MIHVDGVSKRYGDLWALREVSFCATAGEVVLLLGANGAGKTTLVRALLGIIDYSGRILVAGRDPLADGKAARCRIGYMPQSGGLHADLTVRETIDFYVALRGIDPDRGEAALAGVELEGASETTVGDLSGGMRQRLGFALATMSDPPVLLLDEPTASLDSRSRALLVERVRELADGGRTILLSTHAENHLEGIADRSLALEAGRLVA